MFFLIVQAVLALLAVLFLLHALLEARSVRNAGKDQAVRFITMFSSSAPDTTEWPMVSVLLPVYNEKRIVHKIIDAACALQYPRERLDILLLDDSTDETCALADRHLARYKAQGVPVRHARRRKRIGYKAGNLAFGLTLARGDFIAIFDADCLPPADFLLKVMPCFEDDKVGFLQTGIEHVNRDASFLTRFQAMEAGHKEDVTSGLSREGLMASLTGSSCVWRRSCIDAIGGISTATITEDVDMGYSAQLKNWKYIWLGDVTSRAEFPESMAAFRVQRQRWARGLIQNAARHIRRMFATPMPLLARLYACSLMFSALLLAAFFCILLLCLPVGLLFEPGPFFHICCSLFLGAALVWAWYNTARGSQGASLIRRLGSAFGYVIMHFPLSLYYFSAAVQVAAGIDGSFHRTPKGCGRQKIRHPAINRRLVWLEVFSLCYALASFSAGLWHENYWISLYSGLAFSGFSLTLFFSWSDQRKRFQPGSVLITGATGALGTALALEYASPGMGLVLLGRRQDALEDLAARCRARGSDVQTCCMDLRKTDDVRQWMAACCTEQTPDLIIANAGLNANIGPRGEGEPFEDVRSLVEVNLLSVMALVDSALPAFRKKGGGQLAIVSSLAAYYGLPATPTYCATKAGLKAYGNSLRGWLRSENIHVNVILPGYVASPMCSAMPGPKPFLWQPKRAARHIRRGLARDRARISFPFPLNIGIWGLALLPACLAMPLARILGYDR
ncbi:SDR family NAD(P)-dependent oxidoreductase [Desulfovibrio sp. ZJ369]|uniref:SDR family NAD(P)-dependent oxidoreductase n=1 Tax=Desulfovibrio sp. ZJ369 TaxID=2709793 RepID=UPI0013EBC835|nr:SDR family NAD(P)-dependent oxidoreductase [Desulfovibrio sp. ZJ369]